MADNTNLELRNNKDALIFALEKIAFFDDLSRGDLDILMNFMSLYELKSGEYLFTEGEMGQYVCFVVEGRLEVLKKSITGSEITITTITKGFSIGDMSLIDQAPRSASIRARSRSVLAILPRSAFKIILQKHPAIGIKILIGFARFQTENLRKTSNQLNAYTHLLATVCKHKGTVLPKDLEKFLAKDGEKLVKATRSISPLSSSNSFLKKVKKILMTEII
ncbi:MAG: cyclic nucleotide-binding domain-containing protein [Desulfurivibrionaceae bacterium]|nr:cyclic nucleotide-binding domain-containing protein [Desulfobulbales bacterium]MDT8334870.1 cyclic nucleotide-binding domain-containing protein [Desulfurivibrionaceae bacterium]